MRNLLVLLLIMLSGCTGARISSSEARQKITEIAGSGLVPQAVEIRRVVSQSDTQVIAETTVALAFQFQRTNDKSPWRVAAIRMGDRDWITVDELLAAINENRRRDTTSSMGKLVDGIATYRRTVGSAPPATDIVQLTNVLHPQYMTDLVRADSWGHPIVYEVTGTAFRLVSSGADGLRGTPDDIVLPN